MVRGSVIQDEPRFEKFEVRLNVIITIKQNLIFLDVEEKRIFFHATNLTFKFAKFEKIVKRSYSHNF